MDDATIIGARIASWFRSENYRGRAWACSGICGGFDLRCSRLLDAAEIERDRPGERDRPKDALIAEKGARIQELQLEHEAQGALLARVQKEKSRAHAESATSQAQVARLGQRVARLEARLADIETLAESEEYARERP